MKITIIGGGSVRTPRLLPYLVRRAPRLGLLELWLMDSDPERLELIGGMCRRQAEQLDASFRVFTSTDARAAITDASHVITSIRPGLEAGRATDERIAFGLGVLGQETTGAAGFAMAMRSAPSILEYARFVDRVASRGAWLFNFTNPAGLVAQVLHDAGMSRVVGICDSANKARNEVSRFLGIPQARLRHDVYGLNHLTWTRSVRIDEGANACGEELLPALLGDERFVQATHLKMFAAGLRVAEGVFLNEYLHYYYHRDDVLAQLLRENETRGEQVQRLTQRLLRKMGSASDVDGQLEIWREVMDQRSKSYMAHAREGADRKSQQPVGDDDEGYAAVALGCVEAIARKESMWTGLNVPNGGAISGLDADDVV
ncbi:MAG: 6-phospho-beta-glucosidase [Anaerolineae bacterium]|nr:6-phospho-beta-glucosidase [Anaerolineae bacterium]